MNISSLSKATKLKILMPTSYLLLSIVFFVWTSPDNPAVNHIIGIGLTLFAFIFWIIARLQLGNAFSLAPKATIIVTNGLELRRLGIKKTVFYRCYFLSLMGWAR